MATTRQNRGGFNIVMGIFMILFGLCMGAVGGYFAYQSWQLTSKGVKVDAVVVDLEQSPSPGDKTAAPIYEYTVDGQTYQFQSKTKSYPHLLIGDHQTLLYDPNNPARASENTMTELWLLPSIACSASVFLILAAIVVMVVGKFFGRTRTVRGSGFSI